MKILLTMLAMFMALIAVPSFAITTMNGCEVIPIMSKNIPGKVLYYNYADPTCPTLQAGRDDLDDKKLEKSLK